MVTEEEMTTLCIGGRINTYFVLPVGETSTRSVSSVC